MPSVETRQRLANRQAALVKALTGGLAPPADFDAGRVEVAAQALARKRCRGVVKAWPTLTRALGEDFEVRFAAFAAANQWPEDGGPLADGRAFARFLASTGRESLEEARLEVMAVDLSFRSTLRGLAPRRGFALRVALLRRAARLVLGIRVPWFGMRWLSLGLRHAWRSFGDRDGWSLLRRKLLRHSTPIAQPPRCCHDQSQGQ
jgi:hypothetical protein